MNTRTRSILTTLSLTFVLMAFHPITPLGAKIWPENTEGGEPPAWTMAPFLLLFVAEASASALGVAYLFFGWRFTQSFLAGRPGLAKATHASIAFLLIQWWPHGNLHMSVPFSFGSILAIDYAFHIPLMIATLIVLTSVVHVARMTMERASTDTAARANDRAGAAVAGAHRDEV